MANVLVCRIGSTIYTKSSGLITGQDAVRSIEVTPAQHGQVGSARIKLIRRTGGAYTITSRMQVVVALVNDATNVASAVYFHGFVAQDTRWRRKGTTLWECDVDWNDINIILDWWKLLP